MKNMLEIVKANVLDLFVGNGSIGVNFDGDIIITDIMEYLDDYRNLNYEDAQELFLSQFEDDYVEFQYESNMQVQLDYEPDEGDLLLFLFDSKIIAGGIYCQEYSELESAIVLYPFGAFVVEPIDFEDTIEELFIIHKVFEGNYESSWMFCDPAVEEEFIKLIASNIEISSYKRKMKQLIKKCVDNILGFDDYTIFYNALLFDKIDRFQMFHNPFWGLLARQYADGKCMNCSKDMTGIKVNGAPLLESHRINLSITSKDGLINNMQNYVALCPECHCRIHSDETFDLSRLAAKASSNAYFILERVYDLLPKDALKSKSIQPDSGEKNLNNDNSQEFDPSSWSEESYLKMQGYTVAKQVGLSDSQRQKILSNVIDSGKMTKYQIINHLEAMISLRQYQSRYEMAIEKWERDIKFVKQY